ncbi:TRAP transporter substrate-binding protein [Hydromonas duriensis]|uniref:TRAP-type mannitol/chloroaromatic compound transport system substrate-binding protein n=1 Tax=Hydromonas duriensis TaxID=1527608 RepID=A0A4R6YB41_9BURK|nr:TRAP transporter substrate-binding protein DctP [Hydromonas duriensis]TDR32844.1 TRAP-type mannitol/chloroaromatic compound transport system substrate-binding protein [Hydromonas duriensis]
MERRSFLKKAGVVAGTSALAACTAAVDKVAAGGAGGKVEWTLASSFPKNLDTIFGAADVFAKRVAELSNGNFIINVKAAGEIVPGPEVLNAVQNKTVQIGHTASYYFFGKDATFAFDTAVPFGMTSRQHTAWMLHGGGMELMRDFFKQYNVVNFLGGNTGTQMGGWYKKEIKTVEDLKGLKLRIGGFAGKVMAKMGVVPQQIPGGEIYTALEKGTIDGAEWVGPYDDEKLGFYKVAPNYYYPGWWEGGASLSFYVNQEEYAKLSDNYKAIIAAASMEAHTDMQAKYDAKNPGALANLINNGAKLQAFPKEVMEAAFKATKEVFAEEAASNANFKKILDNWLAFRHNEAQWFGLAEKSYSEFMTTNPWKPGA